eukprot:7803596-Alexandrium_andersonii.AAC.1
MPGICPRLLAALHLALHPRPQAHHEAQSLAPDAPRSGSKPGSAPEALLGGSGGAPLGGPA